MRLYMAVTADKYELPLAVADSSRELAEIMGVSPSCVFHKIEKTARVKHKRGREPWSVVVVDIEPEEPCPCDSCPRNCNYYLCARAATWAKQQWRIKR